MEKGYFGNTPRGVFLFILCHSECIRLRAVSGLRPVERKTLYKITLKKNRNPEYLHLPAYFRVDIIPTRLKERKTFRGSSAAERLAVDMFLLKCKMYERETNLCRTCRIQQKSRGQSKAKSSRDGRDSIRWKVSIMRL